MTENVPGQVSRIEADPARPYKAYAALALAFIGAFVAHWIADTDPYTAKDAGQGFLLGLAAAVPGGLGAYLTRNPLVSKEVRNERGEVPVVTILVIVLLVLLILFVIGVLR